MTPAVITALTLRCAAAFEYWGVLACHCASNAVDKGSDYRPAPDWRGILVASALAPPPGRVAAVHAGKAPDRVSCPRPRARSNACSAGCATPIAHADASALSAARSLVSLTRRHHTLAWRLSPGRPQMSNLGHPRKAEAGCWQLLQIC